MQYLHNNIGPSIFRLSSIILFIIVISGCDKRPATLDNPSTIQPTATTLDTQLKTDQTNLTPLINFTSSPSTLTGIAPFSVTIDASTSIDPKAKNLLFAWDQFNDGSIESTQSSHTFVFDQVGLNQIITLNVSDDLGNISTTNIKVDVIEALEKKQPQAVAFASATSGYAHFKVTLDGSNSTDENQLTYSWTQNSQLVSTSAVFDAFLTAGTYNFELTVTNSKGNFSVDQVTVEVIAVIPDKNQPPIIQLSADVISGEIPFNISFSSHSSDDKDGMTYSWMLDNTQLSNTENFNYTLNKVGVFNVELTVTDSEQLTTTKIITVTATDSIQNIDQPPVANIQVNGLLTGNNSVSVTFDASKSTDDRNVITFQWLIGDVDTGSNTSSFTGNFSIVGQYNITLIVTDLSGQQDRITQIVTVN
ncbi:MAG: hypothetical protein HRU38_13120 [Saccharospirillaceae bacterium]|nr:PKD domain-containing protein [Pseudomonadales bacterium]NRB79585.1 hypothetical protein [Saccharospirillaceae bacterium]